MTAAGNPVPTLAQLYAATEADPPERHAAGVMLRSYGELTPIAVEELLTVLLHIAVAGALQDPPPQKAIAALAIHDLIVRAQIAGI